MGKKFAESKRSEDNYNLILTDLKREAAPIRQAGSSSRIRAVPDAEQLRSKFFQETKFKTWLLI